MLAGSSWILSSSLSEDPSQQKVSFEQDRRGQLSSPVGSKEHLRGSLMRWRGILGALTHTCRLVHSTAQHITFLLQQEHSNEECWHFMVG